MASDLQDKSLMKMPQAEFLSQHLRRYLNKLLTWMYLLSSPMAAYGAPKNITCRNPETVDIVGKLHPNLVEIANRVFDIARSEFALYQINQEKLIASTLSLETSPRHGHIETLEGGLQNWPYNRLYLEILNSIGNPPISLKMRSGFDLIAIQSYLDLHNRSLLLANVFADFQLQRLYLNVNFPKLIKFVLSHELGHFIEHAILEGEVLPDARREGLTFEQVHSIVDIYGLLILQTAGVSLSEVEFATCEVMETVSVGLQNLRVHKGLGEIFKPKAFSETIEDEAAIERTFIFEHTLRRLLKEAH